MGTEIIMALIGICSASLSSWLTFIFSRKKYNTEVDAAQLANLSSQLEFYTKLIDDLKLQLDGYIKVSEENRSELMRLRTVVAKIVTDVCLTKSCVKRTRMTSSDAIELVDGSKKSKEHK